MHTFMHAKLPGHKAVTVGSNLHCLTYDVLIHIVFLFSLFSLPSVNSIKYHKDMFKTEGLVALTEN